MYWSQWGTNTGGDYLQMISDCFVEGKKQITRLLKTFITFRMQSGYGCIGFQAVCQEKKQLLLLANLKSCIVHAHRIPFCFFFFTNNSFDKLTSFCTKAQPIYMHTNVPYLKGKFYLILHNLSVENFLSVEILVRNWWSFFTDQQQLLGVTWRPS